MSQGPPPLPRKPASYSPTFLERQNRQYFTQYDDRDVGLGTHDTTPYFYANDSHSPAYNQFCASESGVQRNSNGDIYGRPLPMPPEAQLAMPALDRRGGYEDIFHDYDSCHSSPTRNSTLCFPQSQSPSSVHALGARPLPEAPRPSAIEPSWMYCDQAVSMDPENSLYAEHRRYGASPTAASFRVDGTQHLNRQSTINGSEFYPFDASHGIEGVFNSGVGLSMRHTINGAQHAGSGALLPWASTHTSDIETLSNSKRYSMDRHDASSVNSRSYSEVTDLSVQANVSYNVETTRWYDTSNDTRFSNGQSRQHVEPRGADDDDFAFDLNGHLAMPPVRRLRSEDSLNSIEQPAWPLAVPPIPPTTSKRMSESNLSMDAIPQLPQSRHDEGRKRSQTGAMPYETTYQRMSAKSEAPVTPDVDTYDLGNMRSSHYDSDDYLTRQISRSPRKSRLSLSTLSNQTYKNDTIRDNYEDTAHGPDSGTQSRALPSTNSTTPLSSNQTKRISRSYTASALTTSHPARKPIPHSLTSSSLDITALLPAIPKSLKKISSSDYETCEQVWSRTCLFYWARGIGVDSKTDFIQLLTGLFTHTVPTLSDSYVRKIASDLLNSFVASGEITQSSTNSGLLEFSEHVGDGILPHFTNAGCYSARCHTNLSSVRCYSSRCSRTIRPKHREKHLSQLSKEESEDWAKYWNLSKEVDPLQSLDSREVQRQYQIHEVVYSETDYLADLKILRDVFLNGLLASERSDQDFVKLVFGQVHRLIELSEDYLEPALRERRSTQGPVVSNIGDIFLTWIKGARSTYVQYASQIRYADRSLRSRRAHDQKIRDWLARCESDTRTKKLDFFSYHGSPTRRMQRYALLLGDVLKRSPESSPDRKTLESAIAEIKQVCQECDMQVKVADDKIYLMELNSRLMWKIPQRDLSLSDTRREIRHKGDLQRKSESHTSWQSREVILLDNYLLCLKQSKDSPQKIISREPIPVDYILIDDINESVYKSSSTRILGGTITHVVSSNEASYRKPTLENKSLTVSSIELNSNSKSTAGEILFPFTVKHAGKPDEKMTFYAESESCRSTWVSAILMAKASRWEKVSSHEPLAIRILADQAFAAYPAQAIQIRPDVGPHNAIEAGLLASQAARTKHVSVARVQCSTMFRSASGAEMSLIGTDDGVYADDRGVDSWYKLIPASKVTQIAVLEEFGTLLVLADKTLIAYMLQDLFGTTISGNATKKPGQKLSGNKDVNFFEVGVMKDRLLVIYKKRENGNSVFKVLEPVIGKKQDKKSFFKKGGSASADSFRDFDEFFIPAECYGMQYFRSTICIRCSRGFEILALDAKQPMTIPNLAGPSTAILRSRIEGAKSLGTYRVQEGEFLCCFTECALFVDGSGSLSRPHTLEWEGKPTHAVLLGKYVIAIGKEFVEVWNVEKRSLRQVLTGRDIRLIPHSVAGSCLDTTGRGVMLAMSHPSQTGKQLVLELTLRKLI